MKHVRSLYGKVALDKSRCSGCGHYSIVIDGKTVCCGEEVSRDVGRKLKKETSCPSKRLLLSKSEKETILKAQNNLCFFCKCDLTNTFYISPKMKFARLVSVQYDHLIPLVFCDNQNISNYVASCNVCNIVKYDKVFDTVEALREHILRRRESKGYMVLA